MIVKLSKRDGKALYLNTRAVILAEEAPSGGWLVTVEARVLAPIGPPGSGMWSTAATTDRVLDLDDAGARPLVDHLSDCARNRNNP